MSYCPTTLSVGFINNVFVKSLGLAVTLPIQMLLKIFPKNYQLHTLFLLESFALCPCNVTLKNYARFNRNNSESPDPQSLFWDLEQGQLDFITYPMTITRRRLELATFSLPFEFSRLYFFAGSSSNQKKGDITSLFETFPPNVWIFTLCLMGFCLLLIVIRVKSKIGLKVISTAMATFMLLPWVYASFLKSKRMGMEYPGFTDLDSFVLAIENQKYRLLLDSMSDYR